MKPGPVSFVRVRPQAYRGQDHYNPIWTHICGTQQERLQALAEVQRGSGTPSTDDRPTPAFELRLYVERSPQKAQSWVESIGPEADRLTMDFIRRSGRLPRLKGGFNPITPSSLGTRLC